MSGVRWFFSHQGEVYGPVGGGEMQRLVQSGQLDSGSMVLKEGEKAWVTLEEGARHFEPESSDTEAPPRWVILKQTQEEEKARFVQDGPFDTSEVLQKIQSGEIKYSDHCWREGYSEWKLIREEPELKGKGPAPDLMPEQAKVQEADFELPDPALLEDFDPSIQFSSTQAVEWPSGEAPPPGVDGVDLTEDLSFVFTPDDEDDLKPPQSQNVQPPAATAPKEDPPEEMEEDTDKFERTLEIELDEIEDSVVREPLNQPALQEHRGVVPAASAAPAAKSAAGLPSAPASAARGGKVWDQPHLRQRLLEAEMEASHSEPMPSMAIRWTVILAGAVVLLLFGLKLVKDLGQ